MKNRNKQKRTCLITGASGGLGNSIASNLSSDGYDLILVGRNELRLKQLVSNIGNDMNAYYKCDLSNIDEINRMIKYIRKHGYVIDVLVNCAGVFTSKTISKTTIDDFMKSYNVNVLAPFLLCKEFSEDMIKQKWGRIVNIGSSSSYVGFKNGSAYCSSKHGLLGLSRSLFKELKQYNVRVFDVSPCSIKTKMGRQTRNQDYNTFIDPSDIAKYISFIIKFDGESISEEIRLSRMMGI